MTISLNLLIEIIISIFFTVKLWIVFHIYYVYVAYVLTQYIEENFWSYISLHNFKCCIQI